MPWPAPCNNNVLPIDEPLAPRLEGPSDLQRASVLWIGERQLSLDGDAVDMDSLENRLHELSHSYRLYKCCDRSFLLIVLAVAETPISRLTACLRAALRTDFDHVTFAFTRRETINRPVLGTVSRVLESGAYVDLTDERDPVVPEGEVLVRTKDFSTYDGLARRVVEIGRARRRVLLAI
jgi:hypothetical protein